MKKQEREALREYVAAVDAHTTTTVVPRESVGPDTQITAMDLAPVDTGARLNAADDRLRALGMLA